MSKRSRIWLHFKISENNKYVGICNYCGTKISVKNGSATNLGRHLKTKHPTVSLDKFDPAEVSAAKSMGEEGSSTRLFKKEALQDVESEPTDISEFLQQDIHTEVITSGEYESTASQTVTTVPPRRKLKIPLEPEIQRSAGVRLKVESEPTDICEFLQQDNVIHAEVITSGEYESTASQSVATVPPCRKRKIPLEPGIQQLVGDRLKVCRPDDEFEAFGTYIAHKLRSLLRQQAIIARKLINDVIFEGELETLNKNFKVTDSQIPVHVSFASNDQE